MHYRFDDFELDTDTFELRRAGQPVAVEPRVFDSFMGAFERGVALSRRARALNPLHPGWYHFSTARWHYDRGEYEAVLADVERAALPEFYWSHLLKAAAEGQLGRSDAPASIARLFGLKPGVRPRDELLKWNAAPGDVDHLMEGLRKAGLAEPS